MPSFRARGYNERLVVGSLAAGGTLGILIPPSILLVLYGLTVGVSIGRLFLAGFLPGALLAGVFMLMIGIAAVVWPRLVPREEGPGLLDWEGWRDRIVGTVSLIPIFALILTVLGSIYMGLATPTEAAAAGVSGAFALAFVGNSWRTLMAVILKLLKRIGLFPLLPGELRSQAEEAIQLYPTDFRAVKIIAAVNGRMLRDAFLSSIRTTGMIMLILMAAFTLQFAFGILRISVEMAEWVASFELSPVQFVLILVVFYLLLGTFMESYSMMLTTLPILFPVLRATEVDLLWFGIIMIILLEAAQISPPQGLALYVLHGTRREVSAELAAAEGVREQPGTINDVYIGVLPFMLCMMVVIGIIIAFPSIATWLPDQVKGPR